MGIHGSKEHCLDIAKTLQSVDKKKPQKYCYRWGFWILFKCFGTYIRIHLIPVLTYLTSSLQTSLQNQTKREGYEKDDYNNLIISLLVRTVANSFFRLAKEIWCICSASYFSPLIPTLSNVAVASEIKYVL